MQRKRETRIMAVVALVAAVLAPAYAQTFPRQ
jgi:hypothetical protein